MRGIAFTLLPLGAGMILWTTGVPRFTQAQGEPPMTAPAHSVAFVIRSSAFAPGQPVPRRHTGDGADLSPALTWSGAPAGVKEFALICDDPDAPTAQPWGHWIICHLPGNLATLPEGLPRRPRLDDPAGAVQGINSWPSDNVGYRGPMPPPGKVHHYYFKLYALDAAPKLSATLTKDALLRAMQGHILAQTELIGTYHH